MSRHVTPAQLWASTFRAGMMLAEAQLVIGYRMMGLAGLWAVAPGETARMVNEKPGAWIAASTAAGRAAMSGARPDQIVDAAVRPLGRKTRANARRLSKRGFTTR